MHERDVPVVVHGDIDVRAAPGLRDHLNDLVDEGKVSIVADLSGVKFIDSAGLNDLIRLTNRTRAQGGDLIIVCTSARMWRLLELTGLHEVLSLYDSVDAARAG